MSENDRKPTREFRAAVALTLHGTWVLLVVLLTAGSLDVTPPIAKALTVAGPLLLAFLHIGTAMGLAGDGAWARRAMTPLLVVALITGAISVVVGLSQGRLELPVGALLAVWALRARPGTPQAATRLPIVGGAVVGLAIVLAAWPLVLSVLLRPGGPVIADSSDLALAVALSPGCVDTTTDTTEPLAGRAPEIVDVTVHWDWTRAEPWRAGSDDVRINWYTMSGLEGYEYRQELADTFPPGVMLGDASFTSALYQVDLGERGFEPGAVTLRLLRPRQQPPEHGSIELFVQYVHGSTGATVGPFGTWTNGIQARCEW